MPRSRNRRPAACTSAARFSAAFSLVTFNGPISFQKDLTPKIVIAIITQLYHCDRHHYSLPLTHLRSRNLLKQMSKHLAAALIVALAGSVAGANPVVAAPPQNHGQVPGFYRTKVGDFEVTALFDGAAHVDLDWLTAKKETLDRVAKALHEDPHLLDTGDTGFLVNTGKELILVDAGAGKWFGGGDPGRLGGRQPR